VRGSWGVRGVFIGRNLRLSLCCVCKDGMEPLLGVLNVGL
jgi:hypothetical protein